MEKLNKKNLYLTFDLDWADDFILDKTIEYLEKYNLKATFFVTHKSKLLNTLNKNKYEIALHPNFIKNKKISFEHFLYLKNIYPNAVGMRSHKLFFSSELLPILERNKITYESNIFLFNHLNLSFVKRSKKIISIPFNWSDDKSIELQNSFTLKTFPLKNNQGLNIFNFHPIHIFLNSKSLSNYEKSKKYFNNQKLYNYINKNNGIENLFLILCKEIFTKRIKTSLLRNI